MGAETRSAQRWGASTLDLRAIRQRRVLVVDDVEDNREMYADYLRLNGYEVETAMDGLDAIEKARAARPDIVVMDMSLPRLDGWEATRRLKADCRTKHIRVVALTGHTDASDEREALEAGCDRFLPKPCLPRDLVKAIRALAHLGAAVQT